MPVNPLPPARLDELREALKERQDRYSRKPDDRSRDTGVTVEHTHQGGGCDQPSVDTWVVRDPGGRELDKAEVKGGKLPYQVGELSVNSDGSKVVTSYHLKRSDSQDARSLRKAERNGLSMRDDLQSHYYLAEVPMSGGFVSALPNALRRRGWISPKVLTRLPDRPESIDLGPDGKVAVASGKQVLGWDSRQGLHAWHTFDRQVEKVEFLADGSLGVQLKSAEFYEGRDAALLAPGASQPVEVPFKEYEPEKYRGALQREVRGLDFMREAGTREIEEFFEDPSWIRPDGRWLRHESCDGPDARKATVFLGEDPGQVWIYDRDTARATRVGPLNHPDLPAALSLRGARATAAWHGEGRFLVMQAPVEGRADLVIWDVREGRQALLPRVEEAKVENGAVTFRPPGGELRTVKLEEAGALRDEPWYRQAVVHDLLDAQPEAAGTIEQEETRVVVGDVELPVNRG